MIQEELIRETIKNAYIEGIHRQQNRLLADSGFHSKFKMLVQKDGRLEGLSVDQWFELLNRNISNDPGLWKAETTYSIRSVDYTGNCAAVKIDVFKGKNKFSTDYMLLYKFRDEWKIVSKIFQSPE